MRSRRSHGVLAVLAAALVAAPARAQTAAVPGFELERLRFNPGAAHGLLVDSADLLARGGYRAAVTLQYQHDPLVYLVEGQRVGAVVGSRLGVHLSGAWAPLDWLEVGAQVPVVLLQRGDDLTTDGIAPVSGSAALGTPWLSVKAAPWQQRRGHAVDASVGLALGLPVGSAEALARDASVSVVPTLAVGRVLTPWLRVGGNVSVLVRAAQPLSPGTASARDEVGTVVSTGLVLSTLGPGLRGEVSGRFDVPVTRANLAGEIDLGARFPFLDLFEAYAVVGPGFGRLPGTPVFRLMAGVALAPREKAKVAPPRCAPGSAHRPPECPALDFDGDAVPNGDDACPEAPGVAALRGCPELDSDGDGLLDSVDACPATAGARALDGCLPPDGDGDGVPDAADHCPAAKGEPLHDGCPDSDGDGRFDDVDACPQVAGVDALHGCPDTDEDGDGVVDRVDACRHEKGPADNQGCPAATKQLVVIEVDRLVIKDKVYFSTGKSVVLPRSFALLEQVARILKEHEEVERVVVEGHTDSRGNRDMNLKLSEARAESVKQFLLGAGVPAARLSAKGYGPDRPVASNATAAGREANRRVEFVITGAEERRDVPATQ